ncbi:MAG TPA: hypothetical protein VMW87_02420 [Spirochaetia bacterium]|nr:hypothetical protein [Spirochaetia bacterium]
MATPTAALKAWATRISRGDNGRSAAHKAWKTRRAGGYRVTLDDSGEATLNGKTGEELRRAYRLTSMIGDLVLKIDHRAHEGEWATDQCKVEIDTLARIRPEDRQYFPRILKTGFVDRDGVKHHWIIEKREKLRENATTDKASLTKIYKLAARYGIRDLGALYIGARIEAHTNWAIRQDGTPVIFDFGVVRN